MFLLSSLEEFRNLPEDDKFEMEERLLENFNYLTNYGGLYLFRSEDKDCIKRFIQIFSEN